MKGRSSRDLIGPQGSVLLVRGGEGAGGWEDPRNYSWSPHEGVNFKSLREGEGHLDKLVAL